VFKADKEGHLVRAFWWGGEEFDLGVPSAEIKAAGDAKCLNVCKCGVGKLVYDGLRYMLVPLRSRLTEDLYLFLSFLEICLR
jgi:hypothetical protein